MFETGVLSPAISVESVTENGFVFMIGTTRCYSIFPNDMILNQARNEIKTGAISTFDYNKMNCFPRRFVSMRKSSANLVCL